MALTDTFDGTADTLVTSRVGWTLVGSTNYALLNGSGGVKCQGEGSLSAQLHNTGTTDHYAQATLGATLDSGADRPRLVAVRMGTGSVGDGVQATYNFATTTTTLFTNNSTSIGTSVQALATNDVIKLEAVGADVRFYVNGVLKISATTTALTGTYAGMQMRSTNALTDVIRTFTADVYSPPDTTAPTLTSPTGTKTGTTTASGTVSTDEGNGVLYYWATTNSTETAAAVKASGASQAVSGAGTQSVSFTGLNPSTTYYAHYVHTDTSLNDSARVSSTSFITDDVTPGDPSTVTATVTGGTTATISWTAGSPTAGTHTVQVETPSGAANWATATGVLTGVSFAATGLTPATEYRARVRATNGALNSAWVTGSAFTMDNPADGGGGFDPEPEPEPEPDPAPVVATGLARVGMTSAGVLCAAPGSVGPGKPLLLAGGEVAVVVASSLDGRLVAMRANGSLIVVI